MSSISTHILDASLGKPARQVKVSLFHTTEHGEQHLATQTTDNDGRIKFSELSSLMTGEYRLVFYINDYFQSTKRESFYPKVSIDFYIADETQHYHVPLLISPFSYSTYRGS